MSKRFYHIPQLEKLNLSKSDLMDIRDRISIDNQIFYTEEGSALLKELKGEEREVALVYKNEIEVNEGIYDQDSLTFLDENENEIEVSTNDIYVYVKETLEGCHLKINDEIEDASIYHVCNYKEKGGIIHFQGQYPKFYTLDEIELSYDGEDFCLDTYYDSHRQNDGLSWAYIYNGHTEIGMSTDIVEIIK